MTGAASGIVRATAERLETDGGRVLAVDLEPEETVRASPSPHGVLGLVKTLALEGAERGILVTAVCPGFVRTPLVEGQLADQAEAHDVPEDRVLEEVVLEPHAVKRLVEPEEVAEVVAFLAGPGGRSFTGAPVSMDLGWTAR